MPSAVVEPVIMRLQTYATDRTAARNGWQQYKFSKLQRTLQLAASGHSSIPKIAIYGNRYQLPLMTRKHST
jgi:hypothetical protein